ncbi:DEAD-box ATP-dependent RNA helicase CshB [Alkalibacterium sp. AK22]|uniref:DEAD/DEAH box helicase n=1 Tax=Alkalibacterium sp. AK22 TaxID=1229520 RepID=UPI00044C3EE1|nr:DEAD/DEAH box helicase [Alkalibacterium sp. AK22]EXJ22442.1 DEAD-box ATP-dependent RNA helicase CshB [Alkalibacterium sp. AK22]
MTHAFDKFNLSPYLIEAIEAIGFDQPTEIQNKVIPEVKKGRDIIGQSQTGSGKTHSFLLPLFNKLDPARQEVQIVITAPSRELAEQLYNAASQLAEHSAEEITVQSFMGGTDKSRQVQKLKNKQPHVVIGTPGRLLDLINNNALLTHTAPFMVVDEADMTLDMGFLEDVDKIASKLPSNGQMLVFSATIPQKLQPFLKKYMRNPLIIEVENEQVIADTVDNWLISTKGKNKIDMIHDLLTIGQPYMALVFANTKEYVDDIARSLKKKGLTVAVVHGGISSRERRRVMRQIQNLEYQYVVATDLAARGIDIEGISHVINAEVPQDLDFFVHRVGRTGRNQLPGTAITLYGPDDEKDIEIIEKKGIVFKPKEIKNGEVVDSYDRNRRDHRKNKNQDQTFDPEIHGMRKKAKKNIKPGYKRKIERRKQEKSKRARRLKDRNQ